MEIENYTFYTTYRTMFFFIKVSFINISCEIHVPFHNIMLYKKVQTVKRIKTHGYISSVLNLSVTVQNRCNFGNGDITGVLKYHNIYYYNSAFESESEISIIH